MDEFEDEDSRLFLRMLDDAAEKIFEASSEMMAAKSNAISAAYNIETDGQSSRSLQQDNQLCPELSPIITTLPLSKASTSTIKSRKRRKRSWTSDRSPDTKTDLTVNEITRPSLAWLQTSTATRSKPTETLAFGNNISHHQMKIDFRRNVGSVGPSVKSWLPSIDGNDGKYDAVKAINEVVDRIESLIQKLLSCVQERPTEKKSDLEMMNNCSSVCDDLRRIRISDKTNWSLPPSTSETMQELISRNSSRRSQISDETSWSSPASTSARNSHASTTGSSSQQSGYSSYLGESDSSTDTHSSGSVETESGYEEVGPSRRKWSRSSESSMSSDYVTSSSSHYNSQEQYPDAGPIGLSSQGGSVRSHKWEDYHHLDKGKRLGGVSKLRKKLANIFHHHHHHHHHHYSDVGLLKRLGKMFHRRGKADKSREPVTKSVVKKKQDRGHFRSLIGGLMQHIRHSNKSKTAKDEIGRFASVRHKGKSKTKKILWWPKMGRDKVKVANKGKVKLGRIMTKAKRSQFTAAKKILRQ